MSDFIDKQAVIEVIDNHTFYDDYDSIDKIDLINAIEALPSAEKRGRWIAGAEVIRCKDCVHSDTFPKGADNDMLLKCLGIRYGGVMPDWYCEHAERREEGHDEID